MSPTRHAGWSRTALCTTLRTTLCTTAMLLSFSAASLAADPAVAPPGAEVSELQRARAEVERAREELQRAAQKLAAAYAEGEGESPRAFVYRMASEPHRAVLGITVAPGPAAADGSRRGVKVTAVTPGSGAADAGLQSGDLLLAIDGKALITEAGGRDNPEKLLIGYLRGIKPDTEVKIDYERDGRRDSVEVEARKPNLDLAGLAGGRGWVFDEEHELLLPAAPPVPPLPTIPPMPLLPPQPPAFAFGGLDLQLARLNQDLAGYFDTDHGVLVVSTPEDGALGLKCGDVIQRIDGEAVVAPVEAMDQLVQAAPGAPVKLEVVRHGRKLSLDGTMPERSSVLVHEVRRTAPTPD